MSNKVITTLIILILSFPSIAQKTANGDFNYSCSNGTFGTFFNAFYNGDACGLSPWQVSHGTPDISTTYGAIPVNFSARMYSGAIAASPGYFSEGIFQNYNFVKGNRYFLRFYVSADHPADGGNGDVDEVFISLANGLTGKNYPTQASANFDLPSVTRQDVWRQTNYKTNEQWFLIDTEFIASDNYTQLWVSLKDNGGDPESVFFAKFEIAGLYISCCPYDKYFENTNILTSTTRVENKIETSQTVTVQNGQNVNFYAGKEINLKAGFLAQNGVLFKAATDSYCDCSVGGGNAVNICDVFAGSIQYISNSNGPGVYMPNYLNRDYYTNWYPTSYGYNKPYNAYYWKLKIINRWGQVVYEAENTSGVDGFANQSIKWNGGNVSTGTYYVDLKLTNCTGTYSYYNWLDVAGTAHPNSARIAGEEELSSEIMMEDKEKVLPDKSFLNDIYPNPAKDLITFKYSIAKEGPVTLRLYNETNTITKTIVFEEKHPAGFFEFGYSVENLPSGIYFYSLEDSEIRTFKKLIISR
jgi:hypothetical protein